jgi:hypothetical protein
MSEPHDNVFDLERFRSKKEQIASSQFPSHDKDSFGTSPKELGSHIDNIKKSIQRINKLMEELKTISNKKS